MTMARFTPALGVCLFLWIAGCGFPQETPTPASPPTETPHNNALLAAASPFEDLTEFAEAGDTAGMRRALTLFDARAEAARAALSSSAGRQLDSLVAEARSRREAGDHAGVALASVEAYRVLIDGLDEAGLTVPKAVSLLDYVGFRLHVLAGATAPDWTAMEQTVGDARRIWSQIEGRVDDPGLRDAVQTAVEGMGEAVAAHDARWAAFAASVDLTLVDLLEGYFTHPG